MSEKKEQMMNIQEHGQINPSQLKELNGQYQQQLESCQNQEEYQHIDQENDDYEDQEEDQYEDQQDQPQEQLSDDQIKQKPMFYIIDEQKLLSLKTKKNYQLAHFEQCNQLLNNKAQQKQQDQQEQQEMQQLNEDQKQAFLYLLSVRKQKKQLLIQKKQNKKQRLKQRKQKLQIKEQTQKGQNKREKQQKQNNELKCEEQEQAPQKQQQRQWQRQQQMQKQLIEGNKQSGRNRVGIKVEINSNQRNLEQKNKQQLSKELQLQAATIGGLCQSTLRNFVILIQNVEYLIKTKSGQYEHNNKRFNTKLYSQSIKLQKQPKIYQLMKLTLSEIEDAIRKVVNQFVHSYCNIKADRVNRSNNGNQNSAKNNHQTTTKNHQTTANNHQTNVNKNSNDTQLQQHIRQTSQSPATPISPSPVSQLCLWLYSLLALHQGWSSYKSFQSLAEINYVLMNYQQFFSLLSGHQQNKSHCNDDKRENSIEKSDLEGNSNNHSGGIKVNNDFQGVNNKSVSSKQSKQLLIIFILMVHVFEQRHLIGQMNSLAHDFYLHQIKQSHQAKQEQCELSKTI